jgi:hypothetical protein
MTLAHLRHKVRDRTPVWWPQMQAAGWVTRVARDGSWADMVWSHDWPPGLDMPRDPWTALRVRQPLDRIAEWQHG